VFDWKKWWYEVLENLGLGHDQGGKLDQAANKMQQEVGLYKTIAAKALALFRTRRRELEKLVEDHQKMEQAAIALLREERSDAVNYLVIQLADSSAQIDTLTEEVRDLCSTARDHIQQFRVKEAEAEELLKQHGQLKMAQSMNREFEELQRLKKDLGGEPSAVGEFKKLAGQIRMRQNEFRAIAELESGDAGQRLAVNAALNALEARNILSQLRVKAALPDPSVTTRLDQLDQAYDVLAKDPMYDDSLPESTLDLMVRPRDRE
jgi:phage shock protein A